MAIDKNSVNYMKGYLQHAIVFEKNVYVWSRAMEDVNNRVRRLYNERARLETQKNSVANSLSTLGDYNDATKKQKQKEARKYKKRAKTCITLVVIALIAFFCIGCIIGLLGLNGKSSDAPLWLVVPISGFGSMFMGSFLTGIVPLCIIVFIHSKIKCKNLTTEIKTTSDKASLERQRALLQAQESKAETDWVSNVIEESLINQKQEEIHNQLQIAQKNLKQIYSINILPLKYRNLNAVATLYEYLETGRCNTIQGHGGIYDTYETEKIQLAQLEQQVMMNSALSRIEDGQRQICMEIRNANKTLSGIKTHLSEIEKTNTEIAKNTAISAAANQQTAAAAQWMAWNTWANGY